MPAVYSDLPGEIVREYPDGRKESVRTVSADEAAEILATDNVLLERRVRAGKLTRHEDGSFDHEEVLALAKVEAERDALLIEINKALE